MPAGLAVTYVLAALDALASLNRLHGRVRRQAIEPNRPATIVARYFHGGQPEELTSHPYLLALADQYTTTVRRLKRSFVGPPRTEYHAETPQDPLVCAFRSLQRQAAENSGLSVPVPTARNPGPPSRRSR